VSWSPEPRLIAAGALWLGLALAALVLPLPGVALAALAGGILAAALADWALSRREPAPGVERVLPPRAHVGGRYEVGLRLRSAAARSLALELFEAVPGDLRPSAERFRAELPAGETRVLAYEIHPARRGDRALGAVVAFVRSRLGLLRRRITAAPADVVRVYPDARLLLHGAGLDPRRVLEQLGVRPARRRGEGLEFESLRDFVAGDDPRRLDWAASARRGRPVVRLHQHERNHTLVVALDTSRLMAAEVAGRSKLDHAVDAALALAWTALVTGDRVAMAVFDRELRGFLAPRSHRRELGAFLDFVRPLEPRAAEADYEALARGLAARQRQRALLVVLTDFVEADVAALARPLGLLARRHQLLLVAVRDPLLDALGLDAAESPAPDALQRRLVLADLRRAREAALARVRRLGAHTLDLPPQRITARVMNRYLEIRETSAR
jgi:uncharacterized protein (DUF58 family)